ncbi:MAG TPA: hypothetical protein PLO78_10110 [Candidatus Omnitrophota bacterium]|nr:hypothetical protein [Candidatus Omnitrophota bacterium]
MAQLTNPKHELMARARAQGKTKTEAYMEAYPKATLATARSNASTVMEKYGINARATELLAEVGLTEKKLASRLNDHVGSQTESISLDATKYGLKIMGYGAEANKEQLTYNPVQIIITQMETPEVQDGQSEETSKS